MRGWATAFVAAALVVAGAPAAARLALPDGAVMLGDGAWAVPLVGEPVPWMTDEVRARTIAAAQRGAGYDLERRVEVPLSPHDDQLLADDLGVPGSAVVPLGAQFLFVRPGQFIVSPLPCTTSFVFGAHPFYRIATAGHCVTPGATVIVLAWPSLLVAVGTASAVHDNGPGDDWALVDVAAQWQDFVDPTVAVVGGPSPYIYDGTPSLASPRPVKHVGHAGGIARVGVAYGAEPTLYRLEGAAAPGDSGSPVLTANSHLPTGQALGILTHAILDTGDSEPAYLTAQRISSIPATVAAGDMSPAPPAH